MERDMDIDMNKDMDMDIENERDRNRLQTQTWMNGMAKIRISENILHVISVINKV